MHAYVHVVKLKEEDMVMAVATNSSLCIISISKAFKELL